MIQLKNKTDMAGIRESCVLLSELFKQLRPLITIGTKTIDLENFARNFIKKHKGTPAFLNYPNHDDPKNPFPAALCISINEEVIHGIPSNRGIKPGDIVSIDSGIELGGYYSDAAFSVAMPPVLPETARLLDVTQQCLKLGIEAVKPTNRIHDISRAVFSHATANGFGVVRQFCGHGVGFSQHEEPSVPNYVGSGLNPRLRPGMVIAIEPMINAGGPYVKILSDGWTVVTLDHSMSAHFEHSVLVTETGVEVLTSW